jgi:hypothetical protein
MGISRIRPSRVIKEVTFTVADLPGAAGKTCTVELSGLPTRGIVRRAHLLMRDNAVLNASTADAVVLHTVGGATTSLADDGLTTSASSSSLHIHFFKQSENLAGGVKTGASATFYHITEQFTPSEGIAYDVTGGVLGPEDSNGKLFVTLATGGFDYRSLAALKVRLEIEPSF